MLPVGFQKVVFFLLIQRLHIVSQNTLSRGLLPLLGVLLLNLVLVSEEHLDEVLGSDGPGQVGLLGHDPSVDGPGHVLQEGLLVLGLHVGALHLPDPADWVVHTKVLQ